jgi:hypothetical protein
MRAVREDTALPEGKPMERKLAGGEKRPTVRKALTVATRARIFLAEEEGFEPPRPSRA